MDRTGTDESSANTHSACAVLLLPRHRLVPLVVQSLHLRVGSCCDRLQQPRLTDARGTHAKQICRHLVRRIPP